MLQVIFNVLTILAAIVLILDVIIVGIGVYRLIVSLKDLLEDK